MASEIDITIEGQVRVLVDGQEYLVIKVEVGTDAAPTPEVVAGSLAFMLESLQTLEEAPDGRD